MLSDSLLPLGDPLCNQALQQAGIVPAQIMTQSCRNHPSLSSQRCLPAAFAAKAK